MKTATFRNKRYTVVMKKETAEAMGCCDAPNSPDKQIVIPKGTRLIDLDTSIHEALHACLWDLDEEAVEETAEDIARFLWRLGYRKVDLDER